MSQETAPVDEDTEESAGTSVLELWRTWYDMVGLAFVMIFMLWTRLQSRGRFIRGEEVLFSGNDAFYHFRQVSYSVANWPFTMPYDPWTAYPYGTTNGQFGTLFDQIIATAALIVGLGDPSSRQVALVTLVAPAVFGALVALPVYYIVRRFHGRGPGLFAAVLLAFMPGTFFRRSTVGFADHHVAETLFMAIGVLGVMVALGVAERELPVYEQLLDRDWEGLKRPVGYSALAGTAVFLYIWVWPPGVVLVGIFGVFYTVALVADFWRGRSPEHVALVGVVSMTVVAVLSLFRIAEFSFRPAQGTLLQPTLAIAVALWCGLLTLGARYWDREDLSRVGYPAAVAGSLLAGVLLLAVALPSLFDTLANNVFRAFGFGQSTSALTIAEAQPSPGISGSLDIGQLNAFLFSQYGLAYVVALFGLVWMAFRTAYTEYRAEYVLLVVWSTFLWLMALTQVRFHYYLVLSVVVLTAWTFGQAFDALNLSEMAGRIGDIKPYQVITVVAVFMLVFAPLLPPLASGGNSPSFVVDAGDRFGPGSSSAWSSPADWVEGNTPEVGNYGDAENAAEMPYYGTFAPTNDYEYPDGAYGVMSWWDYGHWITVLAERPPHANPFQQNARSASSFLQASSEERATAILEALPALENPNRLDGLSTEEIQAIAANASTDGEGVRYVMIDDQTAARKFSAVTRWSTPPDNAEEIRRTGREPSPINNTRLYYEGTRYRLGGQNVTLSATSQRYAETMLSKLYFDDARGLSHFRLVHESSTYSIVAGRTNARGQPLSVGRVAQPRYDGWSSQARNVSRTLEQARRAGQALRTGSGAIYDGAVESRIKVYERVPGATITGQLEGESNVSVFATVQLETSTGRTFTYIKRAQAGPDGSFEMTVPYATDNTVGPAEGGTNTSVVATGQYTVSIRFPQTPRSPFQLPDQATADVDVPETAVYGGETIDAGTLSLPEPDGNQSDGNASGSVTPAIGDDGTSPELSLPSSPSPDLSAGADAAGTEPITVDPR